MLATYLRILVFILAIAAAAVLFVFAFTTAAIIVAVLVLIGLIFGRGRVGSVWVMRRGPTQSQNQNPNPFGPVVIDHDPNDLPPPDSKRDDHK